MDHAKPCPLPHNSFLSQFDAIEGAHTDCFDLCVDTRVTLPDFIESFFSNSAFTPEKYILNLVGVRNTSHKDLTRFANDETQNWGAWKTQDRSDTQILMHVSDGPIRSWLMSVAEGESTRLFFGSAILPTRKHSDGSVRIGAGFSVLMGFHKAYARILLNATGRALIKNSRVS